jgi:transposase
MDFPRSSITLSSVAKGLKTGVLIMSNITRIAVDLAKHVFEIACANRTGKIVKCTRLSRDQFLGFFSDYPGVEVVKEACSSAH